MTFKFISVAVAAVLSATVAQATDLPNKKAPPAGPVKKASAYDWSGAYVGGSLGAVMSSGDASSLSGETLNRAVPGIYAGYNYTLADGFIVGVEGDLNYIGFDDSIDTEAVGPTTIVCTKTTRGGTRSSSFNRATCPRGWTLDEEASPGSAGSDSYSVRDIDTLRVRAGYLVSNNLLAFITAGLGVGYTQIESAGVTTSGYQVGWVAGGGLEYAYTNKISMKIDYLYYDLGTASDDFYSIDLKGNLIRGGVAYRF